ncbi:MAG: HDOD domain-containing protein [Candidatus Cloacimonetes bacterium]|nr:HDOD domain-containing protein [Candidatus Cloacimonadota bacterium]
MIKMSDIIADIEFLPPFSKVAQKALTVIRQEDFSMNDMTELIRYDPALTANILKVVNSAAFVTTREINDLKTAMSLLGATQMTSIIMMSAAKKYFDKHLDGYEFYQGELWEHSLSVAVIAVELRRYAPEVDESVLFTAALLHDIGKIVLSQYVSAEFEQIVQLISDKDIDFTTAERKIIGFTHPAVGSAILKKWNFGRTITDVAKYHQSPEHVDNPYVDLTALADFISFLIGKVSQKDALAYSGYARLLMKYNIKSRELEETITVATDRIRDLVENLKA